MKQQWLALKDFVQIPARVPNGTAEVLPRLLTHAQFTVLLCLGGAVLTSMSVFGVCTNVTTLHVFLKIKPLDGVTLSFLFLSVSDLLATTFNAIYGICVILMASELLGVRGFPFNLSALKIFFGILAQIFYTTTILNTLFISISRCACVVHPLQFKYIFTTKLSSVYFFTCMSSTFLIYVIIMCTINFSLQASGNTTASLFLHSVWLAHTRQYVQFFMHSVIPISTQAVISVCVAGMAWALKKSHKFRQVTGHTSDVTGDAAAVSGDKLTGKELQAVQQVLVLSLIYLVCNVIKIGSILAETFVPDFKSELAFRFARLVHLMHAYRRILESLNCSVNIFIYLRFNRKFVQVYEHLAGTAKESTK